MAGTRPLCGGYAGAGCLGASRFLTPRLLVTPRWPADLTMPLALIETRRPWPPEQVAALIDAVYQAQRDALKIPEGDRQIRYVEHRPEHFAVPPGKTENYTLVSIQMFPGRSLAAKRALYQGIVSHLGALGIAPSDILIVLDEPALDNWGLRGGVPGSEVNLGFKLDV